MFWAKTNYSTQLFVLVPALVAGLWLTPVMLQAQDDPSKAELKKFQGTWKIVDGMEDGSRVGPGEDVNRITIKGSSYSIYPPEDKTGWRSFTVEPGKAPKQLDFQIKQLFGDKVSTIHGIYSFEGDQLKLCYNLKTNERPKEFAAPKGSGNTLLILQKLKS